MSKYIITINEKQYEIEVEAISEDNTKQSAKESSIVASPTTSLTCQSASDCGTDAVTAPMPGTILRVNKLVGETVEAGETVLVLEAMKMENDINSPKTGTIKSLTVNKGDTVASGQILFEVK